MGAIATLQEKWLLLFL